MIYTNLGKTGLQISRVGLGGIPVQRTTPERVHELMAFLAENGVNFLDSARGYTISEEYIGAALHGLNIRDKFVIATKSMARTQSAMAEDINTSLANFRTEYIDLYQLHNLRTDADFDMVFSESGAIKALENAVNAGKIRHIGATAHTVTALSRLLDYPQIETVMFPFNIVENQGYECMKKARERGVGFIAMKPLAGGNIENGRLALRYILADELCIVAIPGMADLEEAQINIDAACDTSPLSEQELSEIEGIRASLTGNFCRRCGYCAPCSKGIDIPSLFVLESYLKKYDLADWARSRYESIAIKPSECIACGECEKRCPYNLPIIDRLREVVRVFD